MGRNRQRGSRWRYRDSVDLLAGLRCADGAEMSWAGAAGHQNYLEVPYQADEGQECVEASTCTKPNFENAVVDVLAGEYFIDITDNTGNVMISLKSDSGKKELAYSIAELINRGIKTLTTEVKRV